MTPIETLRRIAEEDRPIECTSLHEWRMKVKKMAAAAIKQREPKSDAESDARSELK